MTDLSAETKAAIAATVGESILASLDGPHRDEILSKAVAELLGGYDLKRVVAESLNARAAKLMAAVIESGAYDQRIDAAIREGMEAVLAKLPHAVTLGLTEMIFGRGGDSYHREPGLILKHLR